MCDRARAILTSWSWAGRADVPDRMRVVVVDAAAHVRSALHLLLEQRPGVTCVAELASGDGLVPLLDSVGADVLLVDSHVPQVDLASLLKTLRQAQPRLRVV